MAVGLTPGHEFLCNAARVCLLEHHDDPEMFVNEPLDAKLEWTPALRFKIQTYINVFVEASEDGPYPAILDLKYREVVDFQQPISVYSVCPASVISNQKGQREMQKLQSRGFGLITVDEEGKGMVLFPAIPLIQWISDAEFAERNAGLPRSISQQVKQAFNDYRAQPVNGVKTLSQLLEGLINKAYADMNKGSGQKAKQSYIPTNQILGDLHNTYTKSNARAAIGASRSFITLYRNLSNHWPKNKKEALEQCTGCRHQFLEGLRTIKQFRDAMKEVGLTGNLPRK